MIALALLAPAICRGQTASAPDARAIVSRALEAYERNDRLTRDYTYKVRDEVQEMTPRGELKAVHSSVDEVLLIAGKRYLLPLEKDDKLLPADKARKEQLKLDRAVAEAGRLSTEEHARRVEEEERARAKEREPLYRIPEAFDFKLDGEQVMAGRPAWVISATPRAGFDGKNKGLLRNLEGKIWVDQKDLQWVRIEATALDSFWLGLFLARVDKGTRLTFEMMKTKDDVWVPKRMSLSASARLFLLKKIDANQEVTFSDYRRFQSESRMLPGDPVPAEQK
jgi:hypothetical protein